MRSISKILVHSEISYAALLRTGLFSTTIAQSPLTARLDRSIAKCHNVMQPLRKTKQDIGARRLPAEEEVKLV